ncbi:MAG: secreted protein [Microbacteriaceae bacterium]|nr:secreted protein [Microbacteriaceae bacterium]
MALFPDDPAPIDQGRRRRRIGWILLAVALVGAVIFAMVPAPYAIESPGPVFNTLGQVDNNGQKVPLIDIPGQKTYPTSGALDMLTVNVYGDPSQSPSWFDVAQAWLDPSKAVIPMDELYAPGETVQQSNKQDAIDMQNSQQDAIAAALSSLGYPIIGTLTVGGFTAGSPADGILKTGDTIVSANGEKVDSVLGLRAIVAKVGAGHPLSMVIVRDKAQQTVQLTPVLDDNVPIVGIYPSIAYTFPFSVKIQLENVGGPSAGQMFALGIIDKLTAGKLNGGKKVAGTGTIDSSGNIGAIGGIRQKLYGARDSGATWFLAPYSNCDEVTGHIPSGIRVLAVKTLKDSLKALSAISSGSSTSGLLTCPSK